MVHISKSKKNGQYYVTGKSSNNGNKLSSTETLKTKPSAYKNILGQMKLFTNAVWAYVQDNTGKKPVVYKLHLNGVKTISTKQPEKAPSVK